MKTELKPKHSTVKILSGLSALVLLFVFSEIALSYSALIFYPLAISAFALVLSFDKSPFKLYFASLTSLILALLHIFAREMLIFTLGAVICGVVISLCFKNNVSKAMTSFYVTFIGFLCIISVGYSALAKHFGSFSPSVLRAGYFEFVGF